MNLSTMNRRALLLAFPMASAGLLLTRCAGSTPGTVSQAVANDLGLLEGTLPVVLTAFSGGGVTVPAAAVAAIESFVQVAETVAAGDAMSQALPAIQRAVADATTAANAVLDPTAHAPALATQIANAVLALLPAVKTAIGVFTAGAMAPGAMTAADARAFLRSVAPK